MMEAEEERKQQLEELMRLSELSHKLIVYACYPIAILSIIVAVLSFFI